MKFSIVTVVKNNISTIRDALTSVSNQVDVEFEHIVLDGNSSDGTFELLNQDQHSWLKVKSERDSGVYDALNKAMMICSGDIIGILHSDDFYTDEFVLKDVERLFLAGADAVYADLDYISRENKNHILRHWKSGAFEAKNLEFGWMPPHPTLFIKSNLIERIGLYDKRYKIASDYDFVLRLFTTPQLKISYLPRVITKMRMGGESNRSLKNVAQKSLEDFQIMKNYFRSPLGTLICKNLRKLRQFKLLH